MRIFYAFLIVLVAVILWMLPISEAVYDFRTELRTDTFSTVTGVGVDTATKTLLDDLYNNDMGSVDIDSDDATDTPLPHSYNSTTRALTVTGLTTNATRILDISYDVNALEGFDAIGTLVDRVPWFWILVIFCFPVAALAALFIGRA